MKKLTSFLAGALTSAILISLPVSALASSGKLTLEVAPIQIQVNGEAFRPVDANGNAVMVFTYNGTTYAPLRALAEAYGLEVGYDAARNTATVGQPLSDQWSVSELPVTHYGNKRVFRLTYSGPLFWSAFQSQWKTTDTEAIKAALEQAAANLQKNTPDAGVTAYFYYGDYSLGTVVARGGNFGADLSPARALIK